jgi:ubiquinone/menaquinone biosynthesis C-methylase UbiE
MTKQKNLFKSWSPDRPVSKGASSYHKAVAKTSWHKENIKELINLSAKKIKNNDLVVDFGAGTGSSAIYLLKHIKKNFKLVLADNSPSWLSKAHQILGKNKKVLFLLLEKGNPKLERLIGKNQINHVVSANTVHLIPNIKEVFKDIYSSLKKDGTFVFQSGNILIKDKEKNVLMIDDSINAVHDLAIEIIKENKRFLRYKKNLEKKIEDGLNQRKFVFPTPRPLEFYLKILKEEGFKNEKIIYKKIRVAYKDWLNFLRVRRLQAGILPEIGGKNASTEEENDRDEIIKKAAKMFFKNLEKQNSLADKKSFVALWTYVVSKK